MKWQSAHSAVRSSAVVSVRRRIVEGPVVRLGGGLLAAQLARVVRAGEGCLARGADRPGGLVVEFLVHRPSLNGHRPCLCRRRRSPKQAGGRLIGVLAHDNAVAAGLGARQQDPDPVDADAPELRRRKRRRKSARMVALSAPVVLSLSSHIFPPVSVRFVVSSRGKHGRPAPGACPPPRDAVGPGVDARTAGCAPRSAEMPFSPREGPVRSPRSPHLRDRRQHRAPRTARTRPPMGAVAGGVPFTAQPASAGHARWPLPADVVVGNRPLADEAVTVSAPWRRSGEIVAKRRARVRRG